MFLMKSYKILILLLLVSFIYSKSYCDYEKEAALKPSKAEDCNANKKDDGYCCYMKSKRGNFCVGYSQKRYKTVVYSVQIGRICDDDDNSEDCVENDDFSIDCKSNYIVFSSLLLILLFL